MSAIAYEEEPDADALAQYLLTEFGQEQLDQNEETTGSVPVEVPRDQDLPKEEARDDHQTSRR